MTSAEITEIILALIGLLGTIITIVFVPYVKKKTTAEERKLVYLIVSEAVYAAEQIYKGMSNKSVEKYDYVTKHLKTEFNLKLSEKELKVLIEAAVAELRLAEGKLNA